MANENRNALHLLINKMIAMVDKKNERLGYDKTFKSTVWEKKKDGSYRISYNGQLYSVSNALETELTPGQNVWVKIPGGVFKHMHICGVNRTKQTT